MESRRGLAGELEGSLAWSLVGGSLGVSQGGTQRVSQPASLQNGLDYLRKLHIFVGTQYLSQTDWS